MLGRGLMGILLVLVLVAKKRYDSSFLFFSVSTSYGVIVRVIRKVGK